MGATHHRTAADKAEEQRVAFNRIIWGWGWPDAPQGDVDYPVDRIPDDAEANAHLPTLFMAEGRDAHHLAHVGTVQIVGRGKDTVALHYSYDLSVPAIPQDRLESVASALGLSTTGNRFDWTRTRWSVQDGDLYRIAFRLAATASRNTPTLFTVSTPPRIERDQVSVMMPFDAGFDPVYNAIEAAATAVNMRCNRASNIWQHPTIIQDVVSLIDRSRIVVCDLSNRNANVFYETGIAHSLGREVILLARHQTDVPFDLAHIRYLPYLPNPEGLSALQQGLVDRMRTILAT